MAGTLEDELLSDLAALAHVDTPPSDDAKSETASDVELFGKLRILEKELVESKERRSIQTRDELAGLKTQWQRPIHESVSLIGVNFVEQPPMAQTSELDSIQDDVTSTLLPLGCKVSPTSVVEASTRRLQQAEEHSTMHVPGSCTGTLGGESAALERKVAQERILEAEAPGTSPNAFVSDDMSPVPVGAVQGGNPHSEDPAYMRSADASLQLLRQLAAEAQIRTEELAARESAVLFPASGGHATQSHPDERAAGVPDASDAQILGQATQMELCIARSPSKEQRGGARHPDAPPQDSGANLAQSEGNDDVDPTEEQLCSPTNGANGEERPGKVDASFETAFQEQEAAAQRRLQELQRRREEAQLRRAAAARLRAAISIQAAQRGYSTRRWLALEQGRRAGAVGLQRIWRGVAGRQVARRRRADWLAELAALDRARVEAAEKRRHEAEAARRRAEERRAQARQAIGSAWRRHVDRGRARGWRARQRELRRIAAAVVQRGWRSMRLRQSCRRERHQRRVREERAVLAMQRGVRGLLGRRAASQIRQQWAEQGRLASRKCILRFLRAARARAACSRAVRAWRRAAVQMQALVRGARARSDPSNPLLVAAGQAWAAASRVQATWRGHSVRRRLAERGWGGLLALLRQRDGVSLAWSDMGDIDVEQFLGPMQPHEASAPIAWAGDARGVSNGTGQENNGARAAVNSFTVSSTTLPAVPSGPADSEQALQDKGSGLQTTAAGCPRPLVHLPELLGSDNTPLVPPVVAKRPTFAPMQLPKCVTTSAADAVVPLDSARSGAGSDRWEVESYRSQGGSMASRSGSRLGSRGSKDGTSAEGGKGGRWDPGTPTLPSVAASAGPTRGAGPDASLLRSIYDQARRQGPTASRQGPTASPPTTSSVGRSVMAGRRPMPPPGSNGGPLGSGAGRVVGAGGNRGPLGSGAGRVVGAGGRRVRDERQSREATVDPPGLSMRVGRGLDPTELAAPFSAGGRRGGGVLGRSRKPVGWGENNAVAGSAAQPAGLYRMAGGPTRQSAGQAPAAGRAGHSRRAGLPRSMGRESRPGSGPSKAGVAGRSKRRAPRQIPAWAKGIAGEES